MESSVFSDAVVPLVIRLFRSRITLKPHQISWLKFLVYYVACDGYGEYRNARRFFEDYETYDSGGPLNKARIWAFWIVSLVGVSLVLPFVFTVAAVVCLFGQSFRFDKFPRFGLSAF